MIAASALGLHPTTPGGAPCPRFAWQHPATLMIRGEIFEPF